MESTEGRETSQNPRPPASTAGQKEGIPSAPFGGGFAEPPKPPRRGHHALWTCLIVLLAFGFLSIVGVTVLAVLGRMLVNQKPAAIRGSGSVGLLRIESTIYDDSQIMEILDYYQNNKGIRAILVRIDSPGGAVGTSQEIYEALRGLRQQGKVVVASMANTAASGGYYVACGAQEIFANPGTLTGSIGVVLGIPNVEELSGKVGFRYENIKSGRFKDVGSIFRPLGEEDRQLLQSVVGDVYEQFLAAILSERSKQLENAAARVAKADPALAPLLGANPTGELLLRAVADGRIFTGKSALAYGLVDHVGTRRDALSRVGKLIGVDNPEIVEYKPKRSLRDLFSASAKSAVETVTGSAGSVRLEYRMPF